MPTIVAETHIYLPGGSHGFRPGDEVPLSDQALADLTAAGHVKPPAPAAAAEPAAESSAPAP